MPRVAAHSTVYRVPDQNILAIRQQLSEQVSDSCFVIEMLSAGLCGTDLAMLSGNRPCRAQVLGHEGVGVVVHAPEQASVAEGDRVIINPVNRNHPEIVIGHSRDGIFRELFVINSAEASDGSHLVACPKGCALTDAECALTEPIASVLYSIELLRERSGTGPLLIRGSGTVGILAAKLWASLTGRSAVVVSKSGEHARWLGQTISWPGNARICSESELPRDKAGYGAAILCCARQNSVEGLQFLLDAVAEGATIDLMAGFPADRREARIGGVDLDRIRWNNSCGISNSPPMAVVDHSSGKTVSLLGHRGTSGHHILQAIEMLSQRIISIADVPHRLISLEELPETARKMTSPETRRDMKFVKAVVDFSREGGGEQSRFC